MHQAIKNMIYEEEDAPCKNGEAENMDCRELWSFSSRLLEAEKQSIEHSEIQYYRQKILSTQKQAIQLNHDKIIINRDKCLNSWKAQGLRDVLEG